MKAELLIRRFDGPAGRKAGDIVSVKSMPHRGWGTDEGLPNYFILRLEDEQADKLVKAYHHRHKVILWGPPNQDGISEPLKSVRSAYRINLDALPTVDKEAAARSGLVFKGFYDVSLIDNEKEELVVK